MPFISYARNYEDVLLWRALGGVERGFYLDIGASHPDDGSVTRAFYDHGWTGVSTTTTDAAFARLTPARPRDVNLRCAVGAGDAADTRSLAEICRAHAPSNIHFLRVDAAGAERAVLESADFSANRPWIVLLAAIDPATSSPIPVTSAPAQDQFEDLLEAAGYRFAWFDGLSRFYLAAERDLALRPHFNAPPNVLDDFIRPADAELARRLVQMQHGLAALQADAGFAALRAQSSDARVRDAMQARTESRQLMERIRNEVTQLKTEVAWRTELYTNAATAIDTLRGELAWHKEIRTTAEAEAETLRSELTRHKALGPAAEANFAATDTALKAVTAELGWYKDLYAKRGADLHALQQEVAWLREIHAAEAAQAAEARRAHDAALAQAATAEAALAAMKASRTWRLTGPVRRVLRIARR
jgi:hypothetical protein